MNRENKNGNIEAGNNTWVYNPPTREERVKLLKQKHNDLDNIEETLQMYIEVDIKARKKYKKLYEGNPMYPFGVYHNLRAAWESMARHRYPYIGTGASLGVVYLVLDESPSTADSTLIRIRNGLGLGDYFYVDDGTDEYGEDTIMVTDIPSAVEAIKFLDKIYKQKIRGQRP